MLLQQLVFHNHTPYSSTSPPTRLLIACFTPSHLGPRPVAPGGLAPSEVTDLGPFVRCLRLLFSLIWRMFLCVLVRRWGAGRPLRGLAVSVRVLLE